MLRLLLLLAISAHNSSCYGQDTDRTIIPAHLHIRHAVFADYNRILARQPRDISDANHIRFAVSGMLSQGIGGHADGAKAAELLETILDTEVFVRTQGTKADRELYAMAQLERAKLAFSGCVPLGHDCDTDDLLRAVIVNPFSPKETSRAAREFLAARTLAAFQAQGS